MTTEARRRLDRLARHMAEARRSATTAATGGQIRSDPAHVAQVLEELANCGALEEVLERAGLAAGMVDP